MRLELEPRAVAFPLSVDSDQNESPFAAASWDFDSLLKKGVAAAQSGDRDQARKLLSQASAINPANEDVWMWMASISEYPEELLAFLNRVLDINPENKKASEWRLQTNSLLATTFVQRALGARNDGSYELAVQYLDQSLAYDPSCEAAWFWKAALVDDEGQKIEFFEKVLAINPDNSDAAEAIQRIEDSKVEAALDRARAFVAEGSLAEAAGIVEDLAAHESPDVRESALMILAATVATDDEKAGVYARVLETNPDNPEAQNAIASIKKARVAAAFDEAKAAAAEGSRSKAVQILEDLLAETPDSVDAWLLISHLSTSLDEKIAALEKVLDIDPENAAARSGLAFLALTFGASKDENEAPTEVFAAEEIQAEAPVAEAPVESTEFTPAANEPEEEVFSDESVEEFHPTEHSPESVEFSYRPTEETVPVEEQIDEPTVMVEEANPDFDSPPAMPEPFNIPLPDPQPAPLDFSTRPEPARSVEEIFGVLETEANPENETVESLSPFATRPLGNDPFAAEVFDTPIIEESAPAAVAETTALTVACSFCSAPNDPQAIECTGCNSTLILTDIDRLLTGTNANKEVVQHSVTAMEAEWNTREFTSGEFIALGLGHFNLGNTEHGFRYLQEASRLSPNDVILSGHVNTVAIRLAEMQRQNEVHQSMPKGKTILVVDDSPTVRKLISGKLEKSGHNVVCAVDGVDALAKLEEGMPDLVLLDITMPRMDGYEVCKQIRANPAGKNLPVVMISGKDGFFDKVRGRMAGTSGYVTKPFGPETLMKALETYLLPDDSVAN